MFFNFSRCTRPSLMRIITDNYFQSSPNQQIQCRNFSSILFRVNNKRWNNLSKILHRNDNVRHKSFWTIRKEVKLSPFTIGFGAMVFFIILDNIYKNFKLSGLELTDYLLRRKSQLTITYSKNMFKTKYASILTKDEVPDFNVTRSVKGQLKLPEVRLTLFQYQTCPFCCKVRTFLDYYGIEYDVVEVNPVIRQEIAFSKKYRKVPILLVQKLNPDIDNEYALQINDSTLIISALTSYLLSFNPNSRHHNESLFNITRWYLNSQVYKNQNEENTEIQEAKIFKAQKSVEELVNGYFLMIGDIDPKKYEKMDSSLAEERHWRRWADDHFVHVLSPNIYRTLEEAKRSFNYFSSISDWQQSMNDFERKCVIQIGAIAMYLVSKNLKRKYQLKDDVRESLFESARLWINKGIADRQFLGGKNPNLADLAVYANFCAIEGCEAFTDAMQTNPKLAKWFANVRTRVNSHTGFEMIKY